MGDDIIAVIFGTVLGLFFLLVAVRAIIKP